MPPTTRPSTARQFGVVVPVKPPRVAKSRLAPLGDDVRRELVTAFAADTVAAVVECRRVGSVLVVTDDVELATGLTALGVSAIPDGRPGLLNESLRQGAAELLRRRPGLVPVALCADLPALRSSDLDGVLDAVPEEQCAFVADLDGRGTTLYTAPDWDRFNPQFGSTSRAAHLAAGAIELAAPATARRDVDTPDDLTDAQRLGLGPRTVLVATRFALL
jgi:2-phospho-L-lactate guanylyltransferase